MLMLLKLVMFWEHHLTMKNYFKNTEDYLFCLNVWSSRSCLDPRDHSRLLGQMAIRLIDRHSTFYSYVMTNHFTTFDQSWKT